MRTIEHAAVASDEEVEAMLDAGCWLVGTFSILFHPDGIEKRRRRESADPGATSSWRASASRSGWSDPGLGPRLALGTDSMHGEMAYEVQTADPLRRLAAATRSSPRPRAARRRLGSSRGPGRSSPARTPT